MQRRSFLRRTLQAGLCDVVIGVPTGLKGVTTTRAYYASTYVFVSDQARRLTLGSFDDPALRGLRIGLHALGAEGANTPPASALAARGLADHVVGYPMWGEDAEESPPARLIDAVAAGEVDTAVVWGPYAGYFAQRHPGRLVLATAAGDPRQPTLAFRYEMAVAVRRGETALRDTLQAVLDRRRADIRAILVDYGVPLVEPDAAARSAVPAGTEPAALSITAAAAPRPAD